MSRPSIESVKVVDAPTAEHIDDLWLNPAGEIILVDCKSTAKSRSGDVTIDAGWQMAYKRRMEVYQWLLRRQGLTVSNTGYFVYCNGQDAEAFDGRNEFAVKLLPYTGHDDWIEGALVDLKACWMSDDIPGSAKRLRVLWLRAGARRTSASPRDRALRRGAVTRKPYRASPGRSRTMGSEQFLLRL